MKDMRRTCHRSLGSLSKDPLCEKYLPDCFKNLAQYPLQFVQTYVLAFK